MFALFFLKANVHRSRKFTERREQANARSFWFGTRFCTPDPFLSELIKFTEQILEAGNNKSSLIIVFIVRREKCHL